MTEHIGKTSRVTIENDIAIKHLRTVGIGYEPEALNEITTYTTMRNTGNGFVPEGQIKIKKLDEITHTIVMEDYSGKGGLTLEEYIIKSELDMSMPDEKDKRVPTIEQRLPEYTFTAEQVKKRAQIVLGLLKATEAYAQHNMSQNDISNTNVIVYPDGSITLLDFNKAITIQTGEGKDNEFNHFVDLNLNLPQDSHYKAVGKTLINAYWTHYEMADPTKRERGLAEVGINFEDALKHHDYHMIMSLVYWSITGKRWTEKGGKDGKIDARTLQAYLQEHNLKGYLKDHCDDSVYGENVGTVLDSMIAKAIEPLGSYKKEDIEEQRKTLANLVTEQEYETIPALIPSVQDTPTSTTAPVVYGTPTTTTPRSAHDTAPKNNDADTLRVELETMIKTLRDDAPDLETRHREEKAKMNGEFTAKYQRKEVELATVKIEKYVYGALLSGVVAVATVYFGTPLLQIVVNYIKK